MFHFFNTLKAEERDGKTSPLLELVNQALWQGEWASSDVVRTIFEEVPKLREGSHDPLEILKTLAENIDLIENELKCTIIYKDMCIHCERKVRKNQEMFTLPLFKAKSSCVEKKIAAYFEEVKIGGVFCKSCSGNTKIRKIIFADAPPTLVLSFPRFEFTGQKKKLQWKSQYSAFLFIEGYNYELEAVICHVGGTSMLAGRFIIFLKNHQLDKWLKYDLKSITEVGLSSVLDQK